MANTDTILNDLEPVFNEGSDQTSFRATSIGEQKTFIAEFGAAADYCNNPGLMPFVSRSDLAIPLALMN